MDILTKISSLFEFLDLKIRIVSPTRKLFPFIHHVECQVKGPTGTTHIGNGLALDEQDAFAKAIGEAIERLCFFYDGSYKTTNGIALHTDLAQAKDTAFRELVERDAYLCHFYSGMPFFSFSEHEIVDTIYADVKSILNQYNIELIVGRLLSKENVFISIAICMGKNSSIGFGLRLGLGCNYSSKKSIDSSILEAISIFPSILSEKKFNTLTLSDFSQILKPKVEDYIALTNNQQAIKWILPFLNFQNTFEPSYFEFQSEYKSLKQPKELEAAEIFVVKAYSKDCQELFFDADALRFLNLDRISQFARICKSKLPTSNLPHLLA